MDNDLIFRGICSFLTGSCLAIAGSLAQLITHNQMSSPSTLGIQAYVVLVVLLLFSLNLVTPFHIEPSIIILCSLVLPVIYLVTRPKARFQIYQNRLASIGDKIVLLGVCFNLFVGALFSVFQFLAITLNIKYPSAIWFGHFKFADVNSSISILLTSILAFLFVWKNKKLIRYFNFGQDFVANLNLNTKRFYDFSILIILLISIICVSYFGVFSFLGLILPHFVKTIKLFKNDPFKEIFYGSVLSGLFLLGLDMMCYFFIIFGSEVPVGMLSSIVGSFYLVLYFSRKFLSYK